ncbi:MAG: hypothetical protein ACO1TE_18205 [Prosthecobacter sp.]
MEIIKVDQLSVAARAGALDGSLAYASVYEQHRDLISQTALGGLRGLEQILSETGVYGDAMRTLKEAAGKIPEASELAHRDPFQGASGSLRDQHNNATWNGLRHQGQGYMATAQGIQGAANYAVSIATTEPEKGYAASAQWAANELAWLGTGYLVNQGDPNMSRHHATVALNSAIDTRNKASTLMNQLAGQNPFPSARYNAAYQVWNAANQVVNHASTVIDFTNNNPIAQIRSHTPTTHDLGGGYSISTWGNSGYWTLTDASGAGIIVRPNGMVDNLNGGPGWKFDTTSTFILPNLTKITVNPGTPAGLLISRGIHAFTISNMKGGDWPAVSSYTDLNGRLIDRSTNDGHIIDVGANAGSWKRGDNVLGDSSSREVIATETITHEEKKDPTDIPITSDMRAFITQMGLENYDYDNDGQLNDVELMEVANQTASYIKSIQDAYEQALNRLAQANQVLNDLNTLIEQLQEEQERSSEGRLNDAMNARSDLQVIERRLAAALQALQGVGTGDSGPQQGDIETNATQVLQQLTGITQSGGLTGNTTTTTPTSSGGSTSPSTGTGSSLTPTGTPTQPTSNGSDPLGDSLRRAGRLLSGILGGGNLNILELPPKPTGTPTTTEGTGTTPDITTTLPTGPGTETTGTVPNNTPTGVGGPSTTSTGSSSPLSQLVTTQPLADGKPLDVQNLATGLETLLVALTQAGLFDTSSTQGGSGTNDLLQMLAGLLASTSTGTTPTSEPPVSLPQVTTPPGSNDLPTQPTITPDSSVLLTQPTTTPPTPSPQLFDFLNTLAQLGVELRETPPQTQTGHVVSPPSTLQPQQPVPQTNLPPLPPSVQQVLELLTGKTAGSLPPLSVTSQQVAAILGGTASLSTPGVSQSSGSGTSGTGQLAGLSRTEEQLLRVLQGLAALGSAGAGQSTGTQGSQAPTSMELRLGLQAFLSAIASLGLLGGSQSSSPQTPNNGGGVVFQSGGGSGNTQAIKTITSNFQTDPELLKIIEENLSKALQTQQRQLSQAGTLFTQSQEIVQKFVTLIKEDDLVRDVVKGDDLSDEQQSDFDKRMQDLRKDWGVDWGSSDSNTPANQSQLVSKVMQSGMMV